MTATGPSARCWDPSYIEIVFDAGESCRAGLSVGEALVAHQSIRAVGFTGSRQGGLALTRIANGRAEPIPVYAEMSSINPVFLFPNALSARAESIGKAFVESLTMGAGQFCTNPGLVIAIEGPDLDRFIGSATDAIVGKAAQTMLTPGIYDAYCSGTATVDAVSMVLKVGEGQPSRLDGTEGDNRLTTSQRRAGGALRHRPRHLLQQQRSPV